MFGSSNFMNKTILLNNDKEKTEIRFILIYLFISFKSSLIQLLLELTDFKSRIYIETIKLSSICLLSPNNYLSYQRCF